MFYLILVLTFLWGLIIGSFLNCLIWRLHTGEGVRGRSYCPKCKKKIAWYDNIPVLSFLILRGKCRLCGKHISLQYPSVELATAFLFTLALYYGLVAGEISYLMLLKSWFLIAVLIVVFVYDLRFYLILDKVMFPSIALLLVINILLGFGWLDLLISAIIGLGFFLIQFLISRGAWIGGGDIRLGLFMGVALASWKLLVLAIFVSYLLGSVVGLSLVATGNKKWGSKIPLGVFLAVGMIFALFWGEPIINWYFSLF